MVEIKVLLVDDEEFVCQNVALKLHRLQHPAHYAVSATTSARQALALVKKYAFDIVVTDIRMPFISGLDFIRMMRENGYQGKILVLSGHDDYQYVREAFRNGADDYILKPIAISELDHQFTVLLSHLMKTESAEKDRAISPEKNSISYAKEYIKTHYADSGLSMNEVAQHVCLSYSHFSALFRKETDTTFPAYLLHVRIARAIELLCDPSMKISEVCYKVGFKYPQQFSNDFKKIKGFYPAEYRAILLKKQASEGENKG